MKLALILLLLSVSTARTAITASWYGESHRGRRMANGQPFDPDQLTCASWFYRLGTPLTVSHRGRSVRVMVTDRGPAWRLVRRNRHLDLSRAAFAQLADTRRGVIRVKIRPERRPLTPKAGD